MHGRWRSAAVGGDRVRRAACTGRFGGGQGAGSALRNAWAGVREPLKGSRKNLGQDAGRRQSWRENAGGGELGETQLEAGALRDAARDGTSCGSDAAAWRAVPAETPIEAVAGETPLGAGARRSAAAVLLREGENESRERSR
jgi:hypothetical protein